MQKPYVVAARLSENERKYLDSVRGALTRSEFLRWLLLEEKKRRMGS